MAFTQVSLPAPAANGSGAAVDVSALGAEKTITVTRGGSAVLKPSVIVEMSNQTVPTKWAPVAFFAPAGEETVVVAARWMRATVTNYKEGIAPTIEVGAEDELTAFAALVATAGNGTGAGVDVSALPLFKTVHVAGPFQGTVNIDVSEDGGVTYQQAFSFPPNESGIQSKVIAADFMRVSRNGVPEILPGLPIINVGASTGGGGGGGGGAIDIQDEGTPLGSFTTLNFVGGGIVATDAGAGVADITITLVDTKQVFQYVATGAETNPFTLALPAARLSVNYNAQLTLLRPAANVLKDLSVVSTSITVNGFDVESSSELEAGDILMITVEDLT